MCFRTVTYCQFHKDIQMVVIACKACNGNGCQFCNNKGTVKYCPTCREQNVSKDRLLGWRR